MTAKAQLEVSRMTETALWDQLSICCDKLCWEYGLNMHERNGVIDTARLIMGELRWRRSQLSLLGPDAAGS